MNRPESVTEVMMERVAGPADGPRVVCIGGGHGLAQVLQAVTTYAGNLDAIVTVADDGGSSGRLAPALDIPPPGDIRRCLLALTPEQSVWRRLFEYRFAGADVQGHSLGNLMMAALADLEGDFAVAVQAVERLLDTTGSVIPAAPRRLHMRATIDNATVEGQVAVSRSRGKVESMWLEPRDVPATPRAIEAIAAADQIILGPGSLYTSVLATLCVPGIAAAIDASPGRLVYIVNLITQDGETLGMDAADHVEALMEISGIRPPATLVAEKHEVTAVTPLDPVRVDPEVLATYGVDVVFGNLVDGAASWPQHDPNRLREVLRDLATDAAAGSR